ncbi:MAG: YgcG family protein [Elusimicrobia bacterium]|nr:MAG: YgcG family protein [Elusimicrobiota bacterium]
MPPLQARVTDQTATLSRDQVASLEKALAEFERVRGSQIAILLVATTRPESIEAYAIRVAESWRLGRKGVDDGLLILVAKNDRKLRIEVGRGLEGAVPDAVAKRIVADVITSRFKEGDFAGGLQAGVARLQAIVGGEALPSPASAAQAGGMPDLDPWWIVGVVVVIALGAVLSRLFGRLGGASVASGTVATLVWLVSGSLFATLIGAFVVFLFVLALPVSSGGTARRVSAASGKKPPRRDARRRTSSRSGQASGQAISSSSSDSSSWSSDSSGSSSSSDSGYSGGGGDFGGGGASGDW